MELQERNEVYAKLEEQKGRKHQIGVAIEEMAELTKELSKYMRTDSYTNDAKICEESADVYICLEQLARMFDPEAKRIPFYMDFKLARLEMFYLEKGLSKTEKVKAFNEGIESKELKIIYDTDLLIYNDKEYKTTGMASNDINAMLQGGGYYKDQISH